MVLSTPVVGGPVVVGGLALGTVRLMEPCRGWRGIINMIQWESQFLYHKEERQGHEGKRDQRQQERDQRQGEEGIRDEGNGFRDEGMSHEANRVRDA